MKKQRILILEESRETKTKVAINLDTGAYKGIINGNPNKGTLAGKNLEILIRWYNSTTGEAVIRESLVEQLVYDIKNSYIDSIPS